MGLLDKSSIADIEAIAKKSAQFNKKPSTKKTQSILAELDSISETVKSYFSDSLAILITDENALIEYVDKLIAAGIAGIDTETTGLDRINDYVVGASLYYPGGVECYIPLKHKVPVFDTWYANQLSYDVLARQLQRIVDANVKLLFANADFDLAMIYKDFHVDLCSCFYHDVILAWRCIQEDERDNSLKGLYSKYVMKGETDPKKFSDFFSPEQFPYCNPNVAKLYAANDAKITYELYEYQRQYIDKSLGSDKFLDRISELIKKVEFPLVSICQNMHRIGMYFDTTISNVLQERYHKKLEDANKKLADMIDDLLQSSAMVGIKKLPPFKSGVDFNSNSIIHMQFLLYDILKCPTDKNGKKQTDDNVLAFLNLPVTNQIRSIRSLRTLISSFIDKLPESMAPDHRIHGEFKQIGAACVIGDTIIPTQHGYHSISELYKNISTDVVGDFVPIDDLMVFDKNQNMIPSDSIIHYKDVPTIKITTQYGFEIEGTYEHPIMLSKYTSNDRNAIYREPKLYTMWDERRFIPLSDVEVGDIIELPCNYQIKGEYQDTGLRSVESDDARLYSFPNVYTEDFAEFLGIFNADGFLVDTKTKMIQIDTFSEDVYNEVCRLSVKLFGREVIPRSELDINMISDYNLCIPCNHIANIESVLSQGVRNKDMPRAIRSSPPSVIDAYIKGLTLNSCVYRDPKSQRLKFYLGVRHKFTAQFIQQYLLSKGILSSLRLRDKKDNEIYYRLTMDTDNYCIFRDTIGFIDTDKVKFSEKNQNYKYKHKRIGDSFWVVVKCKSYSKADVYDIHVPDTHSFISGGFISHNTGRFSSKSPNMQNIPSHASDIRHLFRATPGYVMLSSDYSAQEPRITAYVSQDPKMIKTFQDGKDIYANIASLSFGYSYEECLEFHPETGEYQPEGKKRRTEAKSVVLGICYGRSIPSIADQLYGSDESLTDREKVQKAQKVYDGVLAAFPNLKKIMLSADKFVRTHGYVETILGRRRHLPKMLLPEFEFYPTPGYINPNIDPLDVNTLSNTNDIPERTKKALLQEFKSFRYMGQIKKRADELAASNIGVVNNSHQIAEASRQVLNSIIQGCLGPDVMIQTRSHGIIKVSDAVTLKGVEVWDGRSWTSCDVIPSGMKQKCVIYFTNGQSIVCSPDHKFLCIDTYNHTHFLSCKEIYDRKSTIRVVINDQYEKSEYKYISEIKDKDESHNANNLRVSDIVEDKGSFVAGVVLGRLALDGSIQYRDNGGSYIQQIIAEHESEVASWLFENMSVWLPKYQKIVRSNRSQSLSYIHCYSKLLVKELLDLDIKHYIDGRIFMDTELLRGFICGMFDGDRGCSDKSITLTFGIQYDFIPMLESMQKALLFMGIRSRINMCSKCYHLVISTYDCSRYAKTIGFINKNKQSKAEGIFAVKDCHTFSSRFLCVKSVDITDEYIDMYDVCNTKNGVFVADGLITHNSAADQTKLAILVLSNNKEWKEIGGRLLVPVHDELIAEVPMEHYKRGGEILSQCMIEAAKFLPFDSKCDVTTTLRWYGLEYPCKYTQPTIIDTDIKDEVKWVQYHLVEMEYILPVISEGDEKPRGDAALGINGIITDDYKSAIDSYIQTRHIQRCDFIDTIKQEVLYGEIKEEI